MPPCLIAVSVLIDDLWTVCRPQSTCFILIINWELRLINEMFTGSSIEGHDWLQVGRWESKCGSFNVLRNHCTLTLQTAPLPQKGVRLPRNSPSKQFRTARLQVLLESILDMKSARMRFSRSKLVALNEYLTDYVHANRHSQSGDQLE